MRLPIADCRLPIKRSRAGGGFARSGHNGGQIIRFLKERRQFSGGNNSRLTERLEPERCFVRLLLHCSYFGNEFRLASSAARCAVICSDRSPTANNLICDSASGDIGFRNSPGQFDDSKGEAFGALFQFDGVHCRNVSEQSAIANRQSSIPL